MSAAPIKPGVLARGPWPVEAVRAHWLDDRFVPAPEQTAEADAAIQALKDRDSPSHDGWSARLVSHAEAADGGLELELQPVRWALRLVDDAAGSIAAMCVVRDSEGRWLAGRRAAWLASWPGRWTLGAGGAVDLGESPGQTLTRELMEEWGVTAERVQAEALVLLPNGMHMLIGQAWLAAGTEVVRDPEHDAHAWWPADPAQWPADDAIEPLRRMAALLLRDAG